MKPLNWKNFYEVERNKTAVYRLIPHASVTNNNRRLWRALYKMYEMHNGLSMRLDREGYKFTFREKDLFWFDVIFRQVEGKRKIEFYVSTSEYQAPKLKRKIEGKLDVTFREASAEDLAVPVDNTTVQELRYLKHDIFSLHTGTQESQTPITSLLSVADELQHDGDIARLSICAEAEDRAKWVKNAQWATEKLRKGKVPQRAKVSSKHVTKGLKIGIAAVINEINSLLTDIFQALSNVFFKSEKEYEKEPVIAKSYSLEDEIAANRMSTASRDKLNQPVFKTHIRVVAHSNDRLTRETLGETLALSLGDLSDNNELRGVKIHRKKRKIKIINELNTQTLTRKTKLDVDANLISTDELSKLALQMPGRELQRKYADELDVKHKVEVSIPAALRDPAGIQLGVAEVKDAELDVYMPVSNADSFYRGYTFIGGQGAGKDTAIKNWIIDGCLNHGIGAVIPDAICEEGHRGMADGIRDSLPPDKVIDIDLGNGDWIVPLDLTEVISKLGRAGASRFGDEMIDFLGVEGLSRSSHYLRDAAKASGGSLYRLKRIIEDEAFRGKVIDQLTADGNVRLANALTAWGDVGSKANPILDRLDAFFGNDLLYDIFAQEPKQEVDFERWMAEGKVVIIRVPNRKLGELATKTIVHWITLKTFMTRMLMEKQAQSNGCFIVFNEPEQYITEGLTKLMGRIGTEGRKERLGSLYAFHHWNKLPQALQENLQGGGVQQFLFANDHLKTFELSRHRFEETIPLDQAVKLPMHHAIISVRAGADLQPAFICRMKPPVEPSYDNSFLTLRHARQYGRKWTELQATI